MNCYESILTLHLIKHFEKKKKKKRTKINHSNPTLLNSNLLRGPRLKLCLIFKCKHNLFLIFQLD